MKIYWAHFKWHFLDLHRQPAYLLSTIGFPAIFFLIFAVPEAKLTHSANFLMASFSAFAVMGVYMMEFGMSFAQDKNSSWYDYLRTLPFNFSHLVVSRFLNAFIFASVSAGLIQLISIILLPVELTASQWFYFEFYLFLGSISFCFLGIIIGALVSNKSAAPIINLIYLPLTFAGGLWKPPEILPASIKEISRYLPSRALGELLWSRVNNQVLDTWYLKSSLFYLIFFFILACLALLSLSKKKAGQQL